MKTATAKNRKNTSIEPKQDKFIAKILENIDKVNINQWENYTDLEQAYPSNLFTGHHYKGFNVLALFFDTMANGFSTSKYATFNSISKAGESLKRVQKDVLLNFLVLFISIKKPKKTILLNRLII